MTACGEGEAIVKQVGHHGVTAKHSGHGKHAHHRRGSKHAPKGKQHLGPVVSGMGPVHVAKQPHHPKPRRLTPDGAVALCSVRAVAESLRLALGVVATDDDVLDLYFRITPDPDEGASILAALHAAQTFGLGGARPTRWRNPDVQPSSTVLHDGDQPASATTLLGRAPMTILGLALPEGDHAVTVAPDGCWVSWGQHYDPADFPGAVIEEAWKVRWPA